MTQLDHKIGQRIRELRITRGMKQQELARKIGFTYQQLQKYEAGTNQLSTNRLYQIAAALQVTIYDLLQESGESFPVPGLKSSPRFFGDYNRLNPQQRQTIRSLVASMVTGVPHAV